MSPERVLLALAVFERTIGEAKWNCNYYMNQNVMESTNFPESLIKGNEAPGSRNIVISIKRSHDQRSFKERATHDIEYSTS
jgi:hypothetical protein